MCAAENKLKTYKVDGMTCDHCKKSVTEEVSEVAGVEDIEVDLATGRLAVSGNVADDDVKAAVEEAGYRVVS